MQIGFGLSKVPAMSVVSSATTKRLLFLLLAAMILSCTILCAGMAVLPNEGKVVAVFLAAFPASWIYGTILRYVEVCFVK